MIKGVEQKLDLTGKRCMLVTASLAEAITNLSEGELVEAFSNDPVAHILVKRWCKDTGNELVLAEKQDSGWKLVIRKGSSQP
ncbi:MAG: sulfurtransferase TusA family protein [Candidatus Fervidibacter sp.]|uniref:sulfurtransferase TusA family protein n=1 Tax=Candidatus Fervidibacter sp. TaxID=3100871 RepID=UPI004049FC66